MYDPFPIRDNWGEPVDEDNFRVPSRLEAVNPEIAALLRYTYRFGFDLAADGCSVVTEILTDARGRDPVCCVHDSAYYSQFVSRREADRFLRDGYLAFAEIVDVPFLRKRLRFAAWRRWLGVRIFGLRPWRARARAIARGEIRPLPWTPSVDYD